MKNELDQLKAQWKNEKSSLEASDLKIEGLIEVAKKRKKSVLYAHYGNAIILTLVVIMIATFFYYVTPFQDLISRIGVGLMLGGLVVRIIIEIASAIRSKRIDMTDPALQRTNDTFNFYQFRKKIHGPITISILALYTIGFYMLTPEFSKYMSLFWVVTWDTSYVVIAIVLTIQIRKGVRKEMQDLKEILSLRDEMVS